MEIIWIWVGIKDEINVNFILCSTNQKIVSNWPRFSEKRAKRHRSIAISIWNESDARVWMWAAEVLSCVAITIHIAERALPRNISISKLFMSDVANYIDADNNQL